MHETSVTDSQGNTPAYASCLCGWTHSGGGWAAGALAAQKHRLDALDRREPVSYSWQREPAFTNPARPRLTFLETGARQ